MTSIHDVYLCCACQSRHHASLLRRVFGRNRLHSLVEKDGQEQDTESQRNTQERKEQKDESGLR